MSRTDAMQHEASEAILGLAAAPDDRGRWEAAVEAYAPLCWRIALRMLRDEHLAEDAVQDCLLALRGSARRFRPTSDVEGSARAWVARLAVNTCHHHLRRRRRTQELPARLSAPPPAEPDAELLPLLRQALAELPRNQREAVALRYLAGLAYEDVGRALGIAGAAARVRVHRGLDALRRICARRGWAIPLATLCATLDAQAVASSPALSPATMSKLSAMPLPPLATIGTGAIAAMTIALAATAAICTIAVASAPAVQVAQTPVAHAADAPADAAPASLWPLIGEHLEWLAAQQLQDGSWPERAGGTTGTVGATARALTAFLGAGFDHRHSEQHAEAIARGLRWLQDHDRADADTVDHALRTLALAEAYALSADPTLRPDVEAATRALLALRSGSAWPARADDDRIDLLTSAYAVMALRSAMNMLGDEPAATAVREAREWLEQERQPAGVEGGDAAAAVLAACAGTPRDRIPPLAPRADAAREGASVLLWLGALADFHDADKAPMDGARRARAIEMLATSRRDGSIVDAAHALLGLEVYDRQEALSDPQRLDVQIEWIQEPVDEPVDAPEAL